MHENQSTQILNLWSPGDICKDKKSKEKRDIMMDARRASINKNDAKKTFVTKASDNHTPEIHGVYPYILPQTMIPYATTQCKYLESQ